MRRKPPRELLPWPVVGATYEKREMARTFRRDATHAERGLWGRLRREQLGVRFRRQHPLLGFIVDFYAPSKRLVVEVDGPIHDHAREYDIARTEVFAGWRIRVLRVSNVQVETDPDGVCATIHRVACELPLRACEVALDLQPDGAPTSKRAPPP